MLKIDGSNCCDPNAIQNHILNYYFDLFSQEDPVEVNNNLIDQIIPKLVTKEDNLLFTGDPS